MKITQIDNRSWLIPIADLIKLIIEQVGEKTYRFILLEVLFTEKKVLYATEPKPNLEKSINDVFDFTYLLLNKDNRVFEYEELEEVRENTLEYFGENHPDKLGNELSLSENLFVESFYHIQKKDFNSAIKLLEKAIKYDKWNPDINLLLLDCYVKVNDYSGSEYLLFEIFYMGIKENKMALQPHQTQKYEELKEAQKEIEIPPMPEDDNDDTGNYEFP